MEGARLLPAQYQERSYEVILDDFYTIVGIFSQPARIFLAQNLTNETMMFSMDGATNNFVLPAGGFLLVDAGTNKGTPQTSSIPSGLGLYVQAYSTLPTSGFCTLSYWYAD